MKKHDWKWFSNDIHENTRIYLFWGLVDFSFYRFNGKTAVWGVKSHFSGRKPQTRRCRDIRRVDLKRRYTQNKHGSKGWWMVVVMAEVVYIGVLYMNKVVTIVYRYVGSMYTQYRVNQNSFKTYIFNLK